jgi:very-short-patch-repair endonuclease
MSAEDEYFETEIRSLAESRIELARETWQEGARLCESPIERRLLAALMSSAAILDGSAYLTIGTSEQVEGYRHRETLIVPQLTIGRYRLDFGVVWYREGAGQILLAVECDGHDFHEKTKEQAQRDKSRDREIMSRGWPVIRFTGSEIFRDASECAESVANVLFETWVRRVRPDMRGPI